MPERSPKKPLSWKTWHIPFSRDTITLREAHASLSSLGAKQEEIPLMIQLVENPRFNIPGFDIFHAPSPRSFSSMETINNVVINFPIFFPRSNNDATQLPPSTY